MMHSPSTCPRGCRSAPVAAAAWHQRRISQSTDTSNQNSQSSLPLRIHSRASPQNPQSGASLRSRDMTPRTAK
ncbi:Protein of unknown function [Pyronema omphalodes CBS 100304]|uniref:Uncharacterized protein n=1 Tax=Pyronema omphalodes (strain CBS 100304) TaxID=1076935 RepID=U4LV97_PYROM|nr:Protein of unknown function [Pyronema omphalodes CBS 100304]